MTRNIKTDYSRRAALAVAPAQQAPAQEVPAAVEGPWSLGEFDGNWREIDHKDHGGVIRVVWKMEGDERTLDCEARALAVVDALNAAAPTTQPAPQQEAQEPCPTCAALARTVMLDQVSFDRKPDCYGIRQITDDDGVEEWEDIRTSPDVAREEANDMMATGRGEIYEVVPLWTTPQHAPQPAAKPDAGVLEDAARLDWLEQHDGRYYNIDRVASVVGTGFLTESQGNMPQRHSTLREAIDAAIAAQGEKE